MIQKLLTYTLMIFLCSCSALNGSQTPLRVQSSESDAQIYVNGDYIGDGSIETLVPRRTYVSVLVKKKGFKTFEQELAYCPGVVGAIDIIGGLIWYVPYIGLFFPGAYVVEQEDLTILMEKE